MKIEPKRLKAFLLDSGLVTEAKFSQAQKKAQKTNQKVGDVLVSEGTITQEELIKLEAYILGIPFINLEKEKVSPEILKIIPEPIAKSHNIVAFRKKEQNLEVAMLDPEDLRTIEFIRKKSNLKILPRLTTPEGIKNVLSQYQKTLEAEFGEIIKRETKGIKSIKERKVVEEKAELLKAAEELPIIRIVETLLKHAILQRASDIHIEPTEKEVIVRYRIDGILRDAMTLPKVVRSGIVARIKVLSNLKLDEHRLPQDGRFKAETEDYKYSIRVSILPVFNGEKIVMRLLSETAKAFTLEGLGLRGEALEKIQDNLRKPVGMILVTGPTGSGKTTTLYSMLEILNTPDVNIATIEDPIEYRMPRINQTQVNPKIGLTFASGLRALVRQDPDILMIGEIRDKETASLAINAALTGHLVLSTIHTNTAAGAIPRLIDMGAEPFLISSTLNVILAQRLVRKLCPEKLKYKLGKTEIKNLEKNCDLNRILEIIKKEKIVKKKDDWPNIEFYRPKPSKNCPEGYKGRIGIYEVLLATESIKELIIRRTSADKIQEQAQKEGMRTMVEDGFLKTSQGITSIEEVLRVIIS
ncbi:MAG TPA: type II/IV secretion system protein [Candidatus Nealsonbacteria bacterium]|uniref:Bacterial type II secretion system protein E domain-containing protein n=1 Tax=marine sediment metagenome TaxID=412755 RepID=A0A0F9UZK0_9ZZZZ|nr:type II/IV secretion system protein [Candidatus Nealsonbacteria bacterium]HEB46470.1 type II/IV secretion system protein [Candidatus Nealsonbacteria bacterium]